MQFKKWLKGKGEEEEVKCNLVVQMQFKEYKVNNSYAKTKRNLKFERRRLKLA